MRTVLMDNSLCAYPLRDDVDPDLIFNYITALKDAGVKYVEMDFRSLMKLRSLPEGVKYVFRMVDPMFLRLTGFFDFSYIVLTYTDLKRRIKTDVPVMFEAPFIRGNMSNTARFVRGRIDGELTAFRVRSDFDLEEPLDMIGLYREISSELLPLSVNICPLNGSKTALDAALKFTAAAADSLTLTAGLPVRYCSLEDYMLSLLAMFDGLPDDLSIHSLGRVSVYRSCIFQTGEQALPKLLDILDHDIRTLVNADTGDKVKMRVSLKDTEYLNRRFVSAIEKMALDESIPEGVFENISKAVKHFDSGVYNDALLNRKHKGLLN